MKILDFLCKDAIATELKGVKKRNVIEELVTVLAATKKIDRAVISRVVSALMEREELGSTGIGQGIAIPHAKTEEVARIGCAYGCSKKGVEFNSLDGEPVHIIFLLLAPPGSAGLHLKILAKISRLLKDKFFRQCLREASSPEEVTKVIKEEDKY